jgi:trans-2,3-dihydro-3-hydroxyanthranilate isomerase
MREIEYHICDVFTSKPLEGNQLAVFPHAGDLTTDEMQRLACETNLSETTFVQRRDSGTESERGIRVRIFTTQEELQFAGHPTLGTATMIRKIFADIANSETVVLDLNAGRIAVEFPREGNSGSQYAYGEMMQLDPVFGAMHEAKGIAPLLGLSVEDMVEQSPQTVSTGMPFCITVLRTVGRLAKVRLDVAASERYLRDSDAKFLYIVAPEAAGAWRARMQFYNGEDPATGSAAGCAISYLVKHGLVEPEKRLHLRQGIEIKRPSDLYVSANFTNGKVSEVRVGGSTVPVAKGRFFLE